MGTRRHFKLGFRDLNVGVHVFNNALEPAEFVVVHSVWHVFPRRSLLCYFEEMWGEMWQRLG